MENEENGKWGVRKIGNEKNAKRSVRKMTKMWRVEYEDYGKIWSEENEEYGESEQ